MFCHSFVTLFLLSNKSRALYNELDNLTTGGVSAEVMKDPEAPPLPLRDIFLMYHQRPAAAGKMPHHMALEVFVWYAHATAGRRFDSVRRQSGRDRPHGRFSRFYRRTEKTGNNKIAVWCNSNTRGFDPRVNRASRLIAAMRPGRLGLIIRALQKTE